MALSRQHELHKRRFSRNLGLGIVLAGLVGRIVGLQVAQTTEQNSREHVETITRAIENLDTDLKPSDD